MNKVVKYEQMSIYDFLQDGESQEVQPSETVPQVDEAQDESIYYVLDNKGNTREFLPSSDLDTRKTWEKIIDFEKSLAKKKPTESTDLTLFSVGDVLTVKSSSYYSEDTHPEDYYHLKEFEGSSVTITSVLKGGMRGLYYGTNLRGNRGEVVHFYHRELE